MSSVNYFDSIADKWNVIREDYFEDKLKYISLSQFNIRGKICADLGSGTGFISLALSNESKLVFSIDSSRNMLRELHNAAAEKGINNIYPIKGSADDLPLFDKSIDAVFMNMALHHIFDAKKVVEEIYRILKKDGVVVITDVEKHKGEWARTEMHDEWLGFVGNEGYEVHRNQADGAGGMIAFILKESFDINKFFKALKIVTLAESLGGVESLISHPATMTHASIPFEIRQQVGIVDNLVRLSVGIENKLDLADDIGNALGEAKR